MKILIDANGGDNAPKAQINAINSLPNEIKQDIDLVVLGEEKVIGEFDGEFEKIYTENDVLSTDDVVYAIKNKPNSSIATGLKMVGSCKADCLISAGNTGVLAGMSSLFLKRIKGIRRMALAPMIKSYEKAFLLLDAGVNNRLSPEHYLQFAVMGTEYVKAMFDRDDPKVGLLNVGVEENKGIEELVEVHKLLKASSLNFIGNVEAREVGNIDADVLVADGYAGNIFLKTMEGTSKLVTNKLKDAIFSNLQSKIGGALLKDSLDKMKKGFDYREYGGSAILGVNGLVIKAHGSSDELAFTNTIKQAKILIKNKMIQKIKRSLG